MSKNLDGKNQELAKDPCISQVFVTMTKMPDKSNSEEGKFILAHSFRDSVHGRPNPLLLVQDEAEGHGRGKLSIRSGQEAERGEKELQGRWALPGNVPVTYLL